MGTITKRPAGDPDLQLWDGTSTETYTAETSGGRTMTLTKLGASTDYDWHSRFGDVITRGPWVDVRAYDASGSTESTTGGITSGLKALTLADASDFRNRQGIRIAGAGAAGADLVTTIVSGQGTVNLILTDAASTTVAGAAVNHDDTVQIQNAIDYGYNNGKKVFITGGTFHVDELKFYPGSWIEFDHVMSGGKPTCLKKLISTGFVLKSWDSPTDEAVPSGAIKWARLINPVIDMDAKGYVGIMMECCWECVVDSPRIFNVPATGTFTYTDNKGGAQTYTKAGIMIKGVTDTTGAYYNVINSPAVWGVNSTTHGAAGIVFTSTTSTGSEKANYNRVNDFVGEYLTKHIFIENGNDNVIIKPECTGVLGQTDYGIVDESYRSLIIKPYLEQLTVGINSLLAINLCVIGVGSTTNTTTAWLNSREQNSWSEGTDGPTWDYSENSLRRIEGLSSFGTNAIDFYSWGSDATTLDAAAAVDATGGYVDIPITGHDFAEGDFIQITDTTNYNGYFKVLSAPDADTVRIGTRYTAEVFDGTEGYRKLYKRVRILSDTQATALQLDATSDYDIPTFLGLTRAGLNTVADVETRHPAAATYRQYMGGVIGTAGNPDAIVYCYKATDDAYYWAPLVPIITKTDTGDPAYNFGEGTVCINTFDNTVKMYADSGWRTMASELTTGGGMYDFSLDTGATGDYTLDTIPNNATVIRAWYEVLTPPTSGGAATIAFGVTTNDATGILGATAYNNAIFAAGYHDAVPDGTATNFTTKTTAARAVIMTIAGANLTAGKIRLWYEYIVSV